MKDFDGVKLYNIKIPTGWRQVKRGKTRKGDEAYSRVSKKFIAVEDIKAAMGIGKTINRYVYCLIRQKNTKTRS